MMDRGNVELSCLISLCSANGVGGEELIVPIDEVIPVIQKYPKRFVGLVGLSPLQKWGSPYYPPTYIERAVKEHGFKGRPHVPALVWHQGQRPAHVSHL